jgi:hypothetical protein
VLFGDPGRTRGRGPCRPMAFHIPIQPGMEIRIEMRKNCILYARPASPHYKEPPRRQQYKGGVLTVVVPRLRIVMSRRSGMP